MKLLKITKSSEFQTISKEGAKFHGKTLLVLAKKTSEFYQHNKSEGKNAQNFARLGFTVSKTVGNAVKRNRAKRRLRTAAATQLPLYAKPYYDYVIIAKKEISDADYDLLLSDLKFCLTKDKLYRC